MDGLVAHIIDAEERTEDVRIKELSPFSKMLLSDSVRKGLQQAGFVYPTHIQAAAIPVGKSGMDLLVQSKSGTGKSLIFCTILLEAYSSKIREPQSLIVVPTREIAVQIESVLNQIGRFCQGFRAVCVIGGLDVADDRKQLQNAKAVVGTPGRLLHLIHNEVLNTSRIKLLILDEADKMYSQSFRQDLQRIQTALPSKRQTIACSATFCEDLDEEVSKTMRNPMLISTDQRASLLVGIKQFAYELEENKTSILEMNAKLDAVKYIFGRIAFKQCLIFAGSQSRADSYCNYLAKQGWPCELISGAQDQKTRLQMFQKFREFKTRILIATDLMSRGIDSEHVNLVINLELPTEMVTYLHRIGRGGRFGSHGIAITMIASAKDRALFKRLIGEVGNGMQVLNFPKPGHDSKESDLWNFSDFSADCKRYGCFGTYHMAPLASQEQYAYADLQANKENQANNKTRLYDSKSSIDTKTFQVPADRPVHVTESGQEQTADSQQSSSQQLESSDTIDDASSIAADSVRSIQQDASQYGSILLQKIAIPTLVEFLVDEKPEEPIDEGGEHAPKKKQVDIFEDYKRSVQTRSTLSVSLAELGRRIDAVKIKSFLIDQPMYKEAISPADVYLDYANFQLDEPSSNTSLPTANTGSIDEATQAHDSKEELQNLSPKSSQVNSMSGVQSLPEGKHFPSPVDTHPIPDVDRPPPRWAPAVRSLLPQPSAAQKTIAFDGSQIAISALGVPAVPVAPVRPTSPAVPVAPARQPSPALAVAPVRQPSPITDDTLSSGPSVSNPSGSSRSASISNTARGFSSGFDEPAASGTSSVIQKEEYEEEDGDYEEYGDGTEESEESFLEESYWYEDDEDENYLEEYDDDEEEENYFEDDVNAKIEDDDDDDEEENYFKNDINAKDDDVYTKENTAEALLLKKYQTQNSNPSVANATGEARKVYEAARGAAASASKAARGAAASNSAFVNSKCNHQKKNKHESSKIPPQADAARYYDEAYQEAYRRWMQTYWKQVKFIQTHVRFSTAMRRQQQQQQQQQQ